EASYPPLPPPKLAPALAPKPADDPYELESKPLEPL
ncbi:unnamed protein product, partial [Rotaria magnacalcarata]